MAKGGVTLNDRKLAAEVRTLSLKLIQKYLNGDDEDFKKQLLLRITPTALPRINEHTGEDGEPINLNIINYGNLGSSTKLQTEELPTGTTPSAPEVQDSSIPSAGGQV
jgi:hypothetical protein